MGNRCMKVAVTGAAGQIGYALLFRIASGQMFGNNVDVELQLLELEATLPSLTGVVMELEDCAFPLLKNIICTSDLKTAIKDVNWAILIGSVPRKQGMERSDLLAVNGKIFGPQGRAINDYGAADARVLVVGNPCNTNCLIAMNHAPDVPHDRFYAMTLLDENRARTQLAKKAGVAVSTVKHMAIWGNHSATQYPDFYHAKIGNRYAHEVIADSAWLQNDFISTIQQRGAAVIKARGASSAASAANAIVGSIYRVINDTAVDDSYSLCVCSHGEYGVDEGLIFSFPCRTKNGQWMIEKGIEHNKFGHEKFQATLAELKQERDTVKAMGLL